MLQEIGVKINCRTRSDELVTKDTTSHVYGKVILVVISYSCNWFKMLNALYMTGIQSFCVGQNSVDIMATHYVLEGPRIESL
jgi:hypothetical protein